MKTIFIVFLVFNSALPLNLTAMQEQEINLESEKIPSLKNLLCTKIIDDIAQNRLSLDILDTIPFELAQELVNTSFKDRKDTLAHFYAQKAVKNKSQTIEWLEKLNYVLSKGFTNVNSHDTIPLTHSLVTSTTTDRALDLLWVLLKRGACINKLYLHQNLLEAAISHRNLPAVKILTENTNATVDLTISEYPQPCLMRRINEFFKTDPVYSYVHDHVDLYKSRSNNRYVLAPCCSEGGHEPYSSDQNKYFM